MTAATQSENTDKILAAVEANPGRTTGEIAKAAGVARSSTGMTLNALAESGQVWREAGSDGVAIWRLPKACETRAEAETETADAANAPAAPSPTSGEKLGRGALGEMVAEYLAANPTAEITPSKLAKILGRSSGAVANALEKLVANEKAVRTSDKPKTYSHKS